MRLVELDQTSDLNWIEALSRCSRVGLDVVLVTVLSTSGSTPRDRSAKMVVSVDSVYDSIGGGQLEYLAISHARERLLAQENEPEIKKFPLAAAALQCCGGSMTLLFESVFSNEHRLVLFGAGHVGSRVASMLRDTPIHTTSKKCQNRLRHDRRVVWVGVRPLAPICHIMTMIHSMPLATCRPCVPTSRKNDDRNALRLGPAPSAIR